MKQTNNKIKADKDLVSYGGVGIFLGNTKMTNLNKKIALWITSKVSTMYCAYFFAILAVLGFPGIHATPTQYIQWVSQTFIQLVMLSILAVASEQQGQASERRMQKMMKHMSNEIDRILSDVEEK